jgi:hypothetical protein
VTHTYINYITGDFDGSVELMVVMGGNVKYTVVIILKQRNKLSSSQGTKKYIGNKINVKLRSQSAEVNPDQCFC